jgi:hypothetical protein
MIESTPCLYSSDDGKNGQRDEAVIDPSNSLIFTFKSVCEVKFLCCNARRFILSESLAMVSNTSSHNSGAVYLEK